MFLDAVYVFLWGLVQVCYLNENSQVLSNADLVL